MGGFWSKDDLSADFVQELMDETGFNQKQIYSSEIIIPCYDVLHLMKFYESLYLLYI